MPNIESFEIKRQNEAKLHSFTRAENDERLINQHDVIRKAEALEALEPFAKAYLGLYLEIDSSFSPEQRIRFIAGDELADAIVQGLSVALFKLNEVPSASDIGKKMVEDERIELGYVVLVAMDLLLNEQSSREKNLAELSPDILSAALCFHYANSSEFKNVWVSDLITFNRDLVTTTFQQFWLVQMEHGARFLPGLGEQLKTQQGQQLVGEIILPILSGWSGYKKRTLNVLLAIALRYSNEKKLLPIIEEILETEKNINPRMRMVWLTSAFILNPDAYWQIMVDYTYRSKEKLLPLLDYSVALLDEITLDVDVLTKIIRLIAPKFPPHIDDFGQLAANPQKSLRLFYELANRDIIIGEQVEWLRSARVMKIASPILDNIEKLNRQKHQGESFPEFSEFMQNLLKSGTLKEKRSRFKNKL